MDAARSIDGAKTPRSKRRLRPLRSRIGIQSKLLLILLVTSILSVATVGFIEFQSGTAELRSVVPKQLVRLRDSQERAIKMLFGELTNTLVGYSRGMTAANAVRAFSAGFAELADAQVTPEQWRSVENYYRTEFVNAAEQLTGESLDARTLLPDSPAETYLQVHYTAALKAHDDPKKFHDAGDGSGWSAANARFNEHFSEVLTRNDYPDLLLLDTHGNVVYSVNKGPDLGTNVLTGPYRGSNLGDAYRKAMGSNAAKFVWITDYQWYQPRVDGPTAWLAAPIGTRGAPEGVMALMLPSAKINRVMTADQHWDASGIGPTAETYLVGPDSLMRSDSRMFVQQPAEYRRKAVEAGTPVRVVDEAFRLGGTGLLQPVPGPGWRAAQQGRTGIVNSDQDYLGDPELQAYAPLEIPNSDLHWSILATRDYADAYSGLATFTRRVLLTSTVIIFVICVVAMLLARLFLRPIRRLEAATERIRSGDYHVAVPVKAHDEIGDLTRAFNEMSRSLQVKQQLLNEQRRENDRLLRSLMPETIMRRQREGQRTVAEEHGDVSVVYAEVLGIDEASAGTGPDDLVASVDRLIRQFDSAAEAVGVEPIRTMYTAYLASCGVAVPRLDNAQRAVEFALETQRIIDRFREQVGRPVRLWVCVSSGQVVGGLIGSARTVYDIWGDAVSIAYQVRAAMPEAGVYVTAAVHDTVRGNWRATPAGVVAGQQIWRLTKPTSR